MNWEKPHGHLLGEVLNAKDPLISFVSFVSFVVNFGFLISANLSPLRLRIRR